MDRQILNITANEQILTVDEPIRISTNKVNYIEAHFTLGDNWSGYDSVRAVWFNDFYCISTVLDSLGNCVVPFEVMKRNGNVKVNLVGSISEDDVLTDRLTSYPVVAVIVDCTAQITGANTSPITPSEYEQFVAAVHEDAERAEAGAAASEQSAQNASDSATSAHNSAESAHDDKVAIEEAIAEVIQQIEDFEQVQVVVNTLPPTSPATSDFTDGVLTLGIPQGVKGDTGNGIQSIAKTGTSGLVDTYTITFTDGQTTTFNVTNGAKGDTGNGIQSIAKTSTVGLVDTYTITYTDGNTTTFTVTNGEKGDKGDTGEVSLSELEQATIVQTLSDTEPYNYRRTNNGNGAGHREYDEIVGASVGWNQLALNEYKSGTTTPDGTTTYSYASTPQTILANHVYLFSIDITYNGSILPMRAYCQIGSVYGKPRTDLTTNNKTRCVWLAKTDATSNDVVVGISNVTTSEKLTSNDEWARDNRMHIDLTRFNSEIADYVYTLEQSTAGSGVAWLKTHFPKLFDNGYQPYDSGSIKSVSGLTAHEMVGKNQWDEEWEVGDISTSTGEDATATNRIRSKGFTPCLPNVQYCFTASDGSSGTALLPFFYDADKQFISVGSWSNVQNVQATPQNCHYMRFKESTAYGTTYNHDICINLSDTSINGQYFPYEKHTYPLDSSVTLRGKYVLDNGQLKAVGDVYKSDGTITRNFGVVDLGSLNWGTSDGFFESRINDRSNGGAVCAKYEFYGTVQYPTIKTNLQEKQFAFTSNSAYKYIEVKDSTYSSASDFKTAMSGVYLVYELATSTTEQATPYESPQWSDSHGTEEYVGSELPVGHSTDYPMSLVDTMDGLGNGNYTPKLTITNGVKTITWQNV